MLTRGPPIADLLPHAGAMVMPQAIRHFDPQRIVCTTMRHQDSGNPMRREGRLPALAGVEFAAQAMALHGALRRSPPAALRHGRLASIRDLVLARRFLDDVNGELVIECRLDVASAGVFAYCFSIEGAGQTLLRGRATVMMSDRELA
ncbi:MAG: 3-hydroxylacyl-ACP dehydratase [Casimicrobiaceae bacterium]